MARRAVPLTLDLLAALGEAGCPCRDCLFWALDPVRRARAVDPQVRAAEKDAWVSGLLRDWGSCGRVAMLDGEPVGLMAYAPAGLVPGAASFPTAPASGDAVLVTDVWVHPDHRDQGWGRLLVQGVARDLVTRGGVRAVEAFAHHGRDLGCTVPADFWARVGFRTHRPHPVAPRMRMDLRTALTWRDEVESALERLVGAVRPTPAPTPDVRVPATRTGDGDRGVR